jgi:hypothetical protein
VILPDGFARIIPICHGAARRTAKMPVIAEVLARRVQHAILAMKITSPGCLKAIGHS